MIKARIGVQKNGHLTERCVDYLKRRGLSFDLVNNLTGISTDGSYEILFLKYADILPCLERGFIDAGFISSHSLTESAVSAQYEVIDLPFGVCRVCLITHHDSPIKTINDLQNKTIATSYIKTSQDILKKHNIQATLVPINGSVELFPYLKLVDAAIDFVETGKTVRSLGLNIASEFSRVHAQFIYPIEKEASLAPLIHHEK